MDVHLTADGVPVVMHDATVDRTTDGTGRVGDYHFDELRRLDAGYRWEKPDGPGITPWRGKGLVIPSLEEVFRFFPGIRIVLEIKEKNPALVSAVGKLIHECGRHNLTIVASFYTRALNNRLFPSVPPSGQIFSGFWSLLLADNPHRKRFYCYD